MGKRVSNVQSLIYSHAPENSRTFQRPQLSFLIEILGESFKYGYFDFFLGHGVNPLSNNSVILSSSSNGLSTQSEQFVLSFNFPS